MNFHLKDDLLMEFSVKGQMMQEGALTSSCAHKQ